MKWPFRILVTLFFFFGLKLPAQNWNTLENGIPIGGRCLLNDSVTGNLLVGGGMLNTSRTAVHKVLVWDGSKWDSLTTPDLDPNPTRGLIRYRGDLIVTGQGEIGGIKSEYVKWDGQKWDSISGIPDGFPARMLPFGSSLILGGVFNTIGNGSITSPGVAKWDGILWKGIGTGVKMVDNNFPRVYALEYFQENLIAAGNGFQYQSPNELDIKYFKDSIWQEIPGWVNGSWSLINDLEVYQGELYIAGEFSKAQGALGNNIVRWDGQHWWEVGSGTDFKILDLKVYQGELYAAGLFEEVDGIPASNIAKWNGRQWCSLPSYIFSNGILSLEVWHDTLYALGGFLTINNDTVNYIAKWAGDSTEWLCGPIHPATSVEEHLEADIQVIYHPGSQSVILRSNEAQKYDFQLFSLNGKVIWAKYDIRAGDHVMQCAGFPKGVYHYQLLTEQGLVLSEKLYIGN